MKGLSARFVSEDRVYAVTLRGMLHGVILGGHLLQADCKRSRTV